MELINFAETQNEISVVTFKLNNPNDRWIDIAGKTGLGERSCRRLWKRVKDRANIRGYNPEFNMDKPVADNFFVSKLSTLYTFEDDPEGRKAQWVQSKPLEKQQWELIKYHIEELSEKIEGKSPLVPLSKDVEDLINSVKGSKDYLTVYAIGDPHIGMHAWGEETLENYDTNIAEEFHDVALEYLTSQGILSEKCLILCVGDLFHADDSSNMTPASGNILDVDSRFQRWFEVGMNCIHSAIEKALKFHKFVDVIIVPGNHDPHVTRALNVSMKMFYKNNERVWFDDSPKEYRYYHFGNVMIGTAHGHNTRKLSDLVGIMANDCREEWSNSKRNYWYLGHYHHKNVQVDEISGVEVEILRTLTPPDAWHYGKGYRTNRSMISILHHKEYGEIDRTTCPIELIKNLIMKDK